MTNIATEAPIRGTYEQFVTNPLQMLREAAQAGEVVKLISPDDRFPYLLTNPDHIREVLIVQKDKFMKSRNLQALKVVVGEGILTSEGDKHRQDRQIMQPYFNMKHIAMYAPAMVDQGEAMMQRWQDGDVRNMTGEMMDVTLDIITNTMFGLSVKDAMSENDLRGTFDHLHKLMADKTRKEGVEPQEASDKRNREIIAGLHLLDKLIYGIIEERRQNPQEGRHDLLSILLRIGMSDKELRDQVTTIFLAGHETTANTLAWTWYLLSQNPEAEAKFHAELDTVLQGEKPTAESLKDLTYTNLIVQESMRLYPAAWNMGRIAIDDVTIGDWTFKKGQSVLMSQFAMHRDSRWYDRPDEFIPERFEGDFLKTIPAYAYFPFGGGTRVCIGNNFALMEAVLLLAVIGQKYRFSLAEGAKVVPEPLITLMPGGLDMVVHKR